MCSIQDASDYECCNEKFTQKQLHDHVVTVHKSEIDIPVTCEQCNREFASFEKYVTHFDNRPHDVTVSIKRKNMYICKICSFVAKTDNKLRVHVRHTHESMHPCSICIAWFYSSAELQEHQESKCTIEIIERKFKRMSFLYAHKGALRQNKNYRCKLCLSEFCSVITVRQHFRNKSCAGKIRKNKQYQCPGCSTMFCSIPSLRQHIRLNICGDRKTVAKHKDKNHEDKRYECKRCLGTFHTLAGLKSHIRCNKCNKCNNVVNEHINEHINEHVD